MALYGAVRLRMEIVTFGRADCRAQAIGQAPLNVYVGSSVQEFVKPIKSLCWVLQSLSYLDKSVADLE